MNESDFSEHLSETLRQTAEAIPTSTDLTEGILHQIQQPVRERHSALHVPHQAIASLCAVVVVALLGGLLIHAKGLAPSTGTGTRGSMVAAGTPGLSGQASPVTDQGLTLQVWHAQANALGTTVQIAISGIDPQLYHPSLDDAVLTDNTNQAFSTSLPGAGYTMLDPTHLVSTFAFLPLTPAQLAQPAHLTFTVHHVTIRTNQKPQTITSQKAGLWQLSFVVNPLAETIYLLPSSVSRNQGIGMQLQTLEIAPTTQGQPGGMRVILSVTGLPPNTLLQSFDGWQPTLDASAPTRGYCAPSASCSPSVVSAVLALPGFISQTQGVNSVSFPLASQAQTASQRVGATGTVQLELLYFGQGMPTNGSGTLTIANFQVLFAGSSQPVVAATLPPWQLTIALD
jgi:hypothetical protein